MANAAKKNEMWGAFTKQFTLLVTTAFGLVAALAWNTAIQTLFTTFFGTSKSIAPMFSYAIVVTVIAVIVIFYVSRLSERFNQ